MGKHVLQEGSVGQSPVSIHSRGKEGKYPETATVHGQSTLRFRRELACCALLKRCISSRNKIDFLRGDSAMLR